MWEKINKQAVGLETLHTNIRVTVSSPKKSLAKENSENRASE